jgi:hypothetical protein
LKSKARDNLISAYIDDGEEAKLYLWKKLIIQTFECELLLDWYRTTSPIESNIN